MSSLPDLLDDLATLPPPQVDAGQAWKGGRRRRVRRRLSSGAAAALALLLVTVVVPALDLPDRTPSFARSSGAVVDGHPERIGRQWSVRDLPDRPGPLAALLQVDARTGVGAALFGQGESHWEAVRADGHRWRLPGHLAGLAPEPALSPDGRILGHLGEGDSPYVLQDLVTGRRTEVPELSDANMAPGSGSEYGLFTQDSAHWSPDGQWVLLRGFRRGGGAAGTVTVTPLLVDTVTGGVRPLPYRGTSVGWIGEDRLGWLADATSGSPFDLVTTDLTGAVKGTVALTPAPSPSFAPTLHSGVAQLTTGLLYLFTPIGSKVETVQPFLIVNGAATAKPQPARGTRCGIAAGEREIAFPGGPGEALSLGLADGQRRALTVAAPSVRAQCLVWASRALDQPGRGGGLFGTYDAAWTWWWKEALLLAAVLGGAVVSRRKRRGRP